MNKYSDWVIYVLLFLVLIAIGGFMIQGFNAADRIVAGMIADVAKGDP